MTDDKLKDRVRALFAKARGSMHQAEREAFEAKANELMAKYLLDHGDLADPTEFAHVVHRLGNSGPRGKRMAHLMGRIARAHGVYMQYDNNNDRWMGPIGCFAHLYGRREIIGGVCELYDRLAIDCLSSAAKLKGWDATSTKRQRNDFILGYTQAVGERLGELNRRRSDDNDGRLLPVLTSDYKRGEEMAPQGRRGRRISTYGSGGYRAGNEAGQRANLAGRSMPNAARALNA